MNKSILQGFFSLLLVSSFFINPLLSFAQAAEESPSNIQFSYESPLQVTIDKVTPGADNAVSFNLSFKNEGGFLDDLHYKIDFFSGKELASEGRLFDTTEYVTSVSGDLPRIGARQSFEHSLKVAYPKGIPSDTYFFQMSISNDTKSVWTLAYTDEPVQLEGDGSMFPVPVALARVSGIDGDFSIREIPMMSASSSWELVLPLHQEGGSSDLNLKYEQNAGTLKVLATVYSTTDKETPVYTYPEKYFNLTEDELSVTFDPWEGIKPGDHSVYIDIRDESGTSVLPQQFPVGILIEGFSARIFDIQTSTNIYRPNDALDVEVGIVALNSSEEIPLSLEVILTDKAGETFSSSKNITIKKDTDLPVVERGVTERVSFKDQIVPNKFKPVTVSVTMKRADTGEVLDVHTKSINSKNLFSVHYNANDGAVLKLYIASGLLFIVLIGLAVLAFLRKKTPVAMVLLMFAILLAVFTVYKANEVHADEWDDFTNHFGGIDINMDRWPTGNQGSCPLETRVTFSARYSCILRDTAEPILDARIVVDGDVRKTWSSHTNEISGPVDRSRNVLFENYLGPVSYDVPLSSNSADKEKTWRIEARMRGGSADYPTCNVTDWQSGPNQTVSCTIPSGDGDGRVNGRCGSQAGAESQSEVNERGACNAGSYSNLSDTSSEIRWKCNGTGGGSDATCSANKQDNSATCGTTPNTCRSNSTPSTICTDWYTEKQCSGGDWRTTCGNYKCANGENSQSDSPTCTSSYVERKCASGSYAKNCNNYKCANGQNSGTGAGCGNKGGYVYGSTVCENYVTNNDCNGQGGYKTRLSCGGNWESSYDTNTTTWEVQHTWKCTPGSDSRTTYDDDGNIRNVPGVINCRTDIARPMNGTCGTAASTCTRGTVQEQTDTTAAQLWRCVGTDGGSTTQCSIAKPQCGTLNNTTSAWPSPATATSWCNPGTQSAWVQRADTALNGGEWIWSCSMAGQTSSLCYFNQVCPSGQTLVDGNCTNNRAPDAPRVTGPSEGDPNIYHDFEAVSIDADNDGITYGFDWNNDGTVDEWSPGATSYLASSVATEADYSWPTLGTKTFRVRAKDDNGALSGWTAKTIDITNECRSVRIEYNLNPSIVANRNDTCSFSWGASNIDANGNGAACARPVTCTLDGTAVASSSVGTSINVGNHSLVCTDGVDFTTTQNVKCQLNPSFGEF